MDLVNFSQILSRPCFLVYFVEGQGITIGSLGKNKEAQKIE